ncbi:MAG: DUF2842 domain-containing protein [Pseudomonadota bacterium]
MALSYKTRRRLALLTLLVGLPVYLVVAVNVVELFDRPPLVVEFLIYLALGVLWAIPLRPIFRGVGREDPDAGEPK